MMALLKISQADAYGVSLMFTDAELADRFDDYLISNWEGEPSVKFEGNAVTYCFGPTIQERQVRTWLCEFIVEDATAEAVENMNSEGVSSNDVLAAFEDGVECMGQRDEVLYRNGKSGVTIALSNIGKQLQRVYRGSNAKEG